MDQIAPYFSHKKSGASSDIADEGIALYSEINGMFFFTAVPALIFTPVYSCEVLVFAVEFPETVRVRQAFNFNTGEVVKVIQVSDTLACDQTSRHICYACPVIYFHNLCLLIRTW